MKYIKLFNESDNYLNFEKVKDEIEDICQELIDDYNISIKINRETSKSLRIYFYNKNEMMMIDVFEYVQRIYENFKNKDLNDMVIAVGLGKDMNLEYFINNYKRRQFMALFVTLIFNKNI